MKLECTIDNKVCNANFEGKSVAPFCAALFPCSLIKQKLRFFKIVIYYLAISSAALNISFEPSITVVFAS